MAAQIHYWIACAISVCLTGVLYPFPPLRTRRRAALAAAGLFGYAVLLNVLHKSAHGV
jgi:hypothetical protein